MKAVFLPVSLLILCSLAACTTASGGGGGEAAGETEVTRVHLGQPLARGQIAIEAFEPADATMPEFRSYATSVQRQLARLGWTVVNTVGRSEQVALVGVARGDPAVLRARAIGTEAGTASSGGAATMLEVRIRRRSDGSIIWEGRALSDRSATDHAGNVERLSEALFRDFPGESGRTIRTR